MSELTLIQSKGKDEGVSVIFRPSPMTLPVNKALNVLIVDDDPSIRHLLSVNLAARGYAVTQAEDGVAAKNQFRNRQPNLIILDLVMPGISGVDMCKWVRERTDIPIIVMSGQDEEMQKVEALDAGADDYITKPIKMEEFLARMRAVLRRVTPVIDDAPAKIEIEKLLIDLSTQRVLVDQQDARLTRTEFSIIAVLGRNIEKILTHDELLSAVWGAEFRGSSHYLHVYIGRIRKKIGEPYSNLLETIPAYGYILHATFPNQ